MLVSFPVLLSIVIITYNEEANLARTLASVQPLVANGRGEIILVDSGSTDRTVEIAKSLGAKVFVEDWKGYAAQKNSAIDKAQGDWILSLDADEEVDPILQRQLRFFTGTASAEELAMPGALHDARFSVKTLTFDQLVSEWKTYVSSFEGFSIHRKNFFLGRWIKHGGFYPDPKLRLFRKGKTRFEDRAVHEDLAWVGDMGSLSGALLHHSYPTLADYIDHMNRYSSLGAEMAVAKGQTRFSILNIVFRPILTFIYNYIFRLGFLDGREGLLLHLNHAVYVSWKYSKAWELARTREVRE